MMHRLIQDVIFRHLGSSEEFSLDDAAEFPVEEGVLAFATDSFVVKPLFFPGGDMGSLAISGTVNDLLMKGARPRHLSLSLIIEEGFPIKDLESILASAARTCREANVQVVTGDTKVVGRGDADRLYINTSGVGQLLPGVQLGGGLARPGDVVLVSGTVGEHGVAVMAERNTMRLKGNIRSDAAPLNGIVLPLLERFPGAFHVLRDPTRGGIGTTLNEIALASRIRIELDEKTIPVSDPVLAVCEVLGFDPLYLPCEGRFIAVVHPEAAPSILKVLREELGQREADQIGRLGPADRGQVFLNTIAGGQRILDMPSGELLPRIC
jgi:hydrogenase expression/formation protein HypE